MLLLHELTRMVNVGEAHSMSLSCNISQTPIRSASN
jgi:hypothetical protein